MDLRYSTGITFEVDARGICRDASISGLISKLGISQRDIITLESGFTKYSGVVTEITSPYGSDLGSVSIQSLVKRLKEVNVHAPYFKKGLDTFTLQELVSLLLDDCDERLGGAINGFVGLQGFTNIKLYTPNGGSLMSNLDYLANIVGKKVLGVNGDKIIVFGDDSEAVDTAMTITVGSTSKSKVEFPSISSEEIVNSVGIISGWTTDDGRVREERIGAKIPLTFWYKSEWDLAGDSEKVFQLTPKSIQYERVDCEYSFVHTANGKPIGFASGAWSGSVPPAANWSTLYDGNLDTMMKIDGYADIEPSIALKMTIPAGVKVDGFFIAAKDEPKLLWSMVKGENTQLVESLISEGYRAESQIFPIGFAQDGTFFTPENLDISSTGILTPYAGSEVVGEFISVTVNAKLSAGSQFTSRYLVRNAKTIKVPTSGQEVVVEFDSSHGFNGAVTRKYGAKLRYSATANENKGALLITPFGTGGVDGVLAAYWNFYAAVNVTGYAMSRVIDEDEKNTPDYATLKGYILSPIENTQGVTITLVWKNPGWMSPYFPAADPTAGSSTAPGRFLEALTFFELYPVRISDTTISEFAKTRMKAPPTAGATVTIESSVAPVGTVTLILDDGTTFSERASLFRYESSRSAPDRTIIQLGQDYDSSAKTQAAIIIDGMQGSTFDAVEFSGSQK